MVELCLTAGDAGAAKFRLFLGKPDVWLLDPKFTKDYRNVRPSLEVWAGRNRWYVAVGDQERPSNWRVQLHGGRRRQQWYAGGGNKVRVT